MVVCCGTGLAENCYFSLYEGENDWGRYFASVTNNKHMRNFKGDPASVTVKLLVYITPCNFMGEEIRMCE